MSAFKAKKAATRTPLTDKQIREMIERVAAIQTNRVIADDVHDRLIAVSITLRTVRGEKNYLDEWLRRAELQVREHHKMIRPGGCDCGVCRIKV